MEGSSKFILRSEVKVTRLSKSRHEMHCELLVLSSYSCRKKYNRTSGSQCHLFPSGTNSLWRMGLYLKNGRS